MRTFLFASAAAVLLSAAPAYADRPGIPNDNDHMAALSFALERHGAVRIGRYGAQIVTSVAEVGAVTATTTAWPGMSPGFLLHTSDNDQKQVENQYAR